MNRFLIYAILGTQMGLFIPFVVFLLIAKRNNEAPFGEWSGKREGSSVFFNKPGVQPVVFTGGGVGAAVGALVWWLWFRKPGEMPKF